MLLSLLPGVTWAQAGDFDPATPMEPGQLARVTLSVSPEGAGSVSGGGVYVVGRSLRVYTSAAGSQWKFKQWRNQSTGAVVSTNSSFYLTTTVGTTRLVAEYEELPVTKLTLQCNPAEANASLSGAGNYVMGTSVYVYCYTPSNYVFVNWTNAKTGAVVSNNRYFYFSKTGEEDVLQANFTFSPSTPGEPDAPIIYRTLTASSTDDEAGYTSFTSRTVEVGTSVSISAYNRANYAFLGWERDGAIVSTSSTYTLTMPNRDVVLRAVFEFSPATPAEPEMSDKQPDDIPEEPDPEEPDDDPEVIPADLPGDVNGDGRVNIIDMSLMNGYIMGVSIDNFKFGNADLNQDGRINAVDVALLIELIIKNI